MPNGIDQASSVHLRLIQASAVGLLTENGK